MPAASRPWVGVIAPNNDAHRTGSIPMHEVAAEAERLGFDSAWVGDHLAFNAPWMDSTVALASLASRTQRIGLGYSVLLAAMRQPTLMAKQIASLQMLSGDRLLLGVGVGGENPAEWAAVGVPVNERGIRTDVFLRALPDMLAGKPVHVGAPYEIDVPELLPAVRMPPVLIGGRSDAALARAVRHHAGWLGMWADPKRVQISRDKMAALRANDTDPVPEISLVVFVSPGKSMPRAEEEAAAFVRGIYNMPYEKVRRWVLAGPPEVIGEGLAELRGAGVSGFILSPLGPDPQRTLGDLAEAASIAW